MQIPRPHIIRNPHCTKTSSGSLEIHFIRVGLYILNSMSRMKYHVLLFCVIPVSNYMLKITAFSRKDLIAQQRDYKKKKSLKKAQRRKDLEEERELDKQKSVILHLNIGIYTSILPIMLHVIVCSCFVFHSDF